MRRLQTKAPVAVHTCAPPSSCSLPPLVALEAVVPGAHRRGVLQRQPRGALRRDEAEEPSVGVAAPLPVEP